MAGMPTFSMDSISAGRRSLVRFHPTFTLGSENRVFYEAILQDTASADDTSALESQGKHPEGTKCETLLVIHRASEHKHHNVIVSATSIVVLRFGRSNGTLAGEKPASETGSLARSAR
jgi:hypothetical protein